MRTTLKGKFRRSLATAPSGSEGESVGDTDSRIGPLSKLQHYQGRKRRSFRTAGKVMLWLVASVLVATGGLAGGVWLFLEDSIVDRSNSYAMNSSPSNIRTIIDSSDDLFVSGSNF